MGRKLRQDEVAEVQSWLREEVSLEMRTKAGRLIDALQARALLDARELAAELARDLELWGTNETQSTLLEISALLREDEAFTSCDRLSFLLLSLERDLSFRSSAPAPPSFSPAALTSSDGTTDSWAELHPEDGTNILRSGN